jgi:hypothetical protein
MRLAQCFGERDRDAQKPGYSRWPAEQSIEDRAPRVLKYQRQAAAVAGKCDWARHPGDIQVGPERAFVFEPIEAAGRGIFRRN